MDGIRLCFQVVANNKSISIVSNAVMKQKANAELTIHDVSRISSPACGGETIMLFCDKVTKKDIQIRFFEKNTTGSGNSWQHVFDPIYVHHQVGIKFKTPPYKMATIENAVTVYFELISREEPTKTSNEIAFEYLPQQMGRFIYILNFNFENNQFVLFLDLNLKRKRKHVQEQDTCKY